MKMGMPCSACYQIYGFRRAKGAWPQPIDRWQDGGLGAWDHYPLVGFTRSGDAGAPSGVKKGNRRHKPHQTHPGSCRLEADVRAGKQILSQPPRLCHGWKGGNYRPGQAQDPSSPGVCLQAPATAQPAEKPSRRGRRWSPTQRLLGGKESGAYPACRWPGQLTLPHCPPGRQDIPFSDLVPGGVSVCHQRAPAPPSSTNRVRLPVPSASDRIY